MATLYPFDISSLLHAGAAITATGVGSVAFYDVGADARFPSVAVCAITALDKTDGNETYDLIIEGSVDSAFTTPKQLGSQTISAVGRYLAINGKLKPPYRGGEDTAVAPPLRDELARAPMFGWSDEPTVTVSRPYPGPWSLLGTVLLVRN